MLTKKNEHISSASIMTTGSLNATAIGRMWATVCLILFVAGMVAVPNALVRVSARSFDRVAAEAAALTTASAEGAGHEAKVQRRAEISRRRKASPRPKPNAHRGVAHKPLLELGQVKKRIESPIAEELGEETKPFDSPGEAQEFYFLKRAPIAKDAIADGVKGSNLQREPMPVERYSSAIEQIKNMPQYSTALDRSFQSENEVGPLAPILGTWTPIGPGNVGGRTRGLLIDPSNANIMYAAGVAGGVWKSTNGGAAWAPLNDLMANLAVCSLAMDPNNSSIIYAGTGEGFFNIDAVRGNGVFKSTNGGTSWTQLANTINSNFFFVNDIVVSKGNSQRVYAGTSTGVWRSLDGGTNWTQVHNPGQQGGCMDLAIRTDNLAQDVVLASFGNFVQASVYRNLDAGGAGVWTSVFSDAGMGRTSLAIAPSNQQTMYALAASIAAGTFQNGLQGVFRSTDGGGTWAARVRNSSPSKINTVLLSNPVIAYLTECGAGTSAFNNQGWYDNVIAVDPLDTNRVWVAGIDTFRSDDGGANFGIASHWWATTTLPRYAHADNHAIVFDPGFNGTTNKIMYLGNDGGLFKTTDARAAVGLAGGDNGATSVCNQVTSVPWANLNNGYAATQFYDGVMYPDGQTYFGGTQDNGTVRGTSGGGSTWSTILGGDGGYVGVDPTTAGTPATTVLFAENTGLSIKKSTNGGTSFASSISGITENGGNFLFIAPFIVDPGNPQRLWTGGFAMWRTTNSAGSWTQASLTTCGNEKVSAIAVAPTDGNKVVSGMSDGCINRTSIGLTSTSATNWASVTPRNGYVSWLAFDPSNSNIAYATYASFNSVGTDRHVYKSTDSGATWAGIDGSGATGIPDIPVHTIVVDPVNTTTLYLGTDLGVFTTTDGGATWMKEITGFANVTTESLKINTVGAVKTLFAFTHGRGAWRVLPNGGTTVRTLTVASSNPSSGVSITVSPNDNNGQGNGVTQFTRVYNDSSVVNLTAPSTAGGNTLQKWQRDGVDFAVTTSTNVTMDANHTMTAVYVTTPPLRTLTVASSNPSSSVSITVSPNDNNAQGNGVTQFTRIYNNNVVVMLTAPATAAGNTFQKWQRDGVDFAVTASTNVTMDSDHTMTAVFSTPGETLLLNETFSAGIPATWSVVNGGSGGGTAATWTTANPGGRTIGGAFFTAPFAIVDSDFADQGATQDEQLISPALNASACTGRVVVEFGNQFVWYDQGLNEVADVDVSTNGGSTWVNVHRMQGSDNGNPIAVRKTIDITAAIGSNRSNIKVRFHYYNASFEWWWAIDNVKVKCINGPPHNGSTTGIFRPTNGALYLKNSNSTGFADLVLTYGSAGDYPVAGDWNGDGVDTIGVYRNGTFYLRNSNTVGFADIVVQYGQAGDQPVVGDWDGDGVDTIGVFRNGTFLLRNSNTPGPPDISFGLGGPGDVGIAGDWDGDGIDTTGVYRPSNGALYLKFSNTTGFADLVLTYGSPGDKPVVGDWDGDGIDTIGIYRIDTFFLRNTNTNGVADIVFTLGSAGDIPISGDWDGLP